MRAEDAAGLPLGNHLRETVSLAAHDGRAEIFEIESEDLDVELLLPCLRLGQPMLAISGSENTAEGTRM